jgi:hypothetical protein
LSDILDASRHTINLRQVKYLVWRNGVEDDTPSVHIHYDDRVIVLTGKDCRRLYDALARGWDVSL